MGIDLKAVLLSGGLESTAIAYWLKPDVAITIDYGQPCAAGEIQAAKNICKSLSIAHDILQLSPYVNIPIRNRLGDHMSVWWPYRNQLLITLAAIKTTERRVD